ncbi:hypothetical protein FOCC_FOCC001100 [Frankliniella occidentalis]|nr:hypothetical protein FOCC_FOCC001100 [Frankliniella occidentalis]
MTWVTRTWMYPVACAAITNGTATAYAAVLENLKELMDSVLGAVKIRYGLADRPTDQPSTSERPGRLKYRVPGLSRTPSPNLVVPMSSGPPGTSLGTSRARR